MPRLSPEELADRCNGMGSTCVVEACGLAPWKGAGPMRLYCEKLGILNANDAEEEEDAEWLEWGHIQEPVIADWYAKTRGVQLYEPGRVWSDEYPFMWATLDRAVVGSQRLVEVKNVGSPHLYSHWNVSDQDGIPRYVMAQVQVAMRHARKLECDVVASIGGRPPHVWTVFYDQETAGILTRRAAEFWHMVKNRIAPTLDHTDATRVYLTDKYPSNADREVLEADLDTDAMGQARAQCAMRLVELEKQKRLYDAMLMARIGKASGLKGEGWQMTWKVGAGGVRRTRFTVKGVRDEE